MIVVDSNLWIDYFNNKFMLQTDTLDGLVGQQHLYEGI